MTNEIVTREDHTDSQDADHVDVFEQRQDTNAPFQLVTREFQWVVHYGLFLEKGYRLRKRYHPCWIGGWVERGVSVEDVLKKEARRYEEFQDSIPNKGPVTDGVRIDDGMPVAFKLIHPPTKPGDHLEHGAQELEIMQYLASPSLKNDPNNPYPLLLDSFPAQLPKGGVIMVLPLLRDCQMPPFRLVVEALAVMRQVLEQLVFLHDHNIAHRDIRIENIMMDPRSLYPNGMNPLINYCQNQRRLPPEPKPKDRIDVPVKYHLIDYGYSIKFSSFEDRVPVINMGAQWKLDEFYGMDAEGYLRYRFHDPFKADIKAYGITFSRLFPSSFLKPFFDACFLDPHERPDARALLQLFNDLTGKLSRVQLLGSCRQFNRTNGEGWSYWMALKHVVRQGLRNRVEYGRLVVKAVRKREVKF